MGTYIRVKYNLDGIHSYQNASGKHDYLKDPHRHTFYIEVKAEVFHDDREIEFFALKDEIRHFFEVYPGYGSVNTRDFKAGYKLFDFEGSSCEMLASDLLKYLSKKFEFPVEKLRRMEVTVSEDNDNAAIVDNYDQLEAIRKTQGRNYESHE